MITELFILLYAPTVNAARLFGTELVATDGFGNAQLQGFEKSLGISKLAISRIARQI